MADFDEFDPDYLEQQEKLEIERVLKARPMLETLDGIFHAKKFVNFHNIKLCLIEYFMISKLLEENGKSIGTLWKDDFLSIIN